MDNSGFDIAVVNGRATMWIDSEKLNECLEFYRRGGADIISISPVRGYKLPDLEFLRDHPYIKELEIVFPARGPFDVAPVLSLRGLRSLTVAGAAPISLRELPSLEEFRGWWHSGLEISGCEGLRVLSLYAYKPRSGTLTELPELPSLKELGLSQAGLTSLRGIERYRTLTRLDLAYLSRLETLAGVEALSSLEVLDCDKCRKLRGHESVQSLGRLRVLKFNDCGEIQSLRFIERMPALEEVRFVGTNIGDGDLRPLLRLKFVGFLRRKHYSHTPEEMDRILREKGGGAIPRLD